MGLLCRWITEDGGFATVKASSAKEHSFLPDHVVLIGVTGVHDDSYPEMVTHTLVLRKVDIFYLMGGVEVPAEARLSPKEKGVESELPGGPPPPPPAKRKS